MHGMQACHACGALNPLEAVLCAACDAYVGRSVAVMGKGVMHAPPVERIEDRWMPGRDAAAPAPAAAQAKWDVPKRKPGGLLVRVSYKVEWKQHAPHGAKHAYVRALGHDWQLTVGRRSWAVMKKVRVWGVDGFYLLHRRPTNDVLEGQAAAERWLAEHLQTMAENNATTKR